MKTIRGRLWNIEGNKQVFSKVLDSTDVMRFIDFSSDGRFIASVGLECHDINVWDASLGLKHLGTLKV
jgi:WD40 repeat protein